jgi:hypothetical protein
MHQTASDKPDLHDCGYNLFRNKDLPEIVCAVPEACPVPSFIDPEQWAFEHPLHPTDPTPPGFHAKAAKMALRFNGFYLFYALASTPAVQTFLDTVASL